GQLDEAIEALTGFKPISFRKRESRFPVYSHDELLKGNIPDEFYVIDNALVLDQPLLIAGPEKSLKTSTMLDMAVCLMSGRPCLDHLQVGLERNVLIFSGESGIRTLQKDLRTMYRSRCGRNGRNFNPTHLTHRVHLST